VVVGEAFYEELGAWRGFVIVPVMDDGKQTWFRDADGDGYNDLMCILTAYWDDEWGPWDLWPSEINDDGWVVGYCDPGWDYWGYEPFLIIPDDALANPWFKDGDGNYTNDLASILPVGAEALDINSKGQIVIWGPVVLQTEVAEDGTVTFAQTQLPPTTTYAWIGGRCINENGEVAGIGKPFKRGNPDYDPLLWQADKGTRGLESLSNMAGFSDLGAAESINNVGQIVGSGTTRAGARGYIATPIAK
jgi:hypothetical protein